MKINVHIERLVLEGVPLAPGGQRLVQMALAKELSRLMSRGGLGAALASGAAVPEIKAADMHLPSGASPTRLGTRIAQSMYRGIGR